MRNILFIPVLAALLLASFPLSAAQPPKARMGIAAVVNDDIITFSDVDNRVYLYMSGSQGKPPEEALRAMEQQVLSKLIDEKLQMSEARNLGITVPEEQLQEAFASIAQQNRFSAEEFKKRLAASGVNVNTLYDQIRSEIAWSQVAKRKLRPQVVVTENEIDNEITLGNIPPEAAGGTIHLKQIAMPILPTDPQDVAAAKLKRAENLKSEISSCAAMDAKMKEFPSPGTTDSPNVPLANLPEAIRAVTDPLPLETLSAPLRAKDGIIVLMVCARTEPAAATTPGDGTAAAPQPPLQDEMIREQVANKLGFKRLQQMQERYLRDLRATAFIDKRI